MLVHRIETWLQSVKNSKVQVLKIQLEEIAKEHRCEIAIDDEKAYIWVKVRGNGAALRDVVTKLDQMGYLD